MPQEIPKAFAVEEIPIKRFEATQGPLSSGWTLYDSSKLYEKLSAHCGFFNQKELDKALEETGFNKAVRIRMEVLAWKERCRIEAQNLNKLLTEYKKQIKKIEERLEVLNDTLQQTRNIKKIVYNYEELPALSAGTYKKRCRIQSQNLNKLLVEYRKQVKKIEERLEVLNDTLQQTRNILRIQRENPNEDCL